MNKRLLMLPLLLTGATMRSVDKEVKKVEKIDPFSDLFNEIQQNMQRFENRFKAIEQHMFMGFDQINQLRNEVEKKENKQAVQKVIEVVQKDNFVCVKMNLGELKVHDVSVEADGDSLEGKVPLRDGSAHFYVQNGVLFGLTVRRETTNKGANDKEKKFLLQTSDSTKIETLPTYVEKLEGTEVSYENGVLTLKMPIVPVKKGTKLNVVAK